MLKRFIVSLLVLVFVFVSPTLAKSYSIRAVLDAAVKGGIISRYAVIPLGKPLPSNGREAKYTIAVRVKGKSKVIPFEVFFASPKGSARHVYKIGFTAQSANPFDDDGQYALGQILGFFGTFCLAFESTRVFQDFYSEVITTIQADGSGQFDKTLGALQVAAGGAYAFKRGSLIFALIRSGHPSNSWKNHCTL
jgi:hypothetical protein